MKSLITLFIILIAFNINAQRRDYSIVIDPEQDPDSVYILVSEHNPVKYRQGKGKWVNYEKFISGEISGLEPVDKNWFNTNLTANANHTHDARYKISTVNKIGGWFLNCGVSGASTAFGMDSTAIGMYAPEIGLHTGGVGGTPRIIINSVSDQILMDADSFDIKGDVLVSDKITADKLKLDDLPVYADEAAAVIGGLLTGEVYRTSTGEIRIKL